MYRMHEPLYQVIAREAYLQEKCFMCYKPLKDHVRCRLKKRCGRLLCNGEDICDACKVVEPFLKACSEQGKKRKGFRKNKSLDTKLD